MDGPANVQCYVPCVRGYLDGKIDEPPSEGGRVRGGGYRLGRHVPLVGLEEEVRDGQHEIIGPVHAHPFKSVSYTHLRAHETDSYLVCRLLLEQKKKQTKDVSMIVHM